MSDGDIKITVKFGARNIPLTISRDLTVQNLKTLLLPLTSVLPRGQKIISKGKVLENETTLRESGVTNGAKLMLVGTQGLHQGDGPILRDAPSRPISRKTNLVNERKEIQVDKSLTDRWKGTGIAALAECNLKAIPDEVWACAPFIRFLDVSNNSIQRVPSQIDCLKALTKLFLNGNGFSDESINWQGIESLERLKVLSLSQNCLSILPHGLGCLTNLQQLNVANNKLTALPNEIGFLTKLEILKANNNRINSIPPNLENCTSLVEVDLSSNHLSELPDQFCSLRNLKALHLGNNVLNHLPNSIFRMCTQLSTLDLHNTEVTMDELRQFEGWEDFDQRRRAKHQKQLDFRVMNSAEFDEGADKS